MVGSGPPANQPVGDFSSVSSIYNRDETTNMRVRGKGGTHIEGSPSAGPRRLGHRGRKRRT